MGNLAHLIDKVEPADFVELIHKGFDEANGTLKKNLETLTLHAATSQNEALAAAVRSTVETVGQSQKIIMQALLGITEQVLASSKGISDGVNSTGKAGTVENKALQSQIDKLSASLAKIPTKHPEQKKTDLTGLDKAVMAVGLAVQNIPKAKFPDMSNNFKLMEKKIADLQKKLSQRVHVFEIERDKQSELVTKITVKTK